MSSCLTIFAMSSSFLDFNRLASASGGKQQEVEISMLHLLPVASSQLPDTQDRLEASETVGNSASSRPVNPSSCA